MLQSRVRLSAAEFFALPETNLPTELLHGELVVSPSPVPKHQRASRKFLILLDDIIPDGEIFTAPMDLYLDEQNIPQPDLIWVAANSQCKITEKRLEGTPELIVEIFSPGTAKIDRSDKYKLYERHGVKEYWMVDPYGEYVEVCCLIDGKYMQQGIYGAGEQFISPVLGGKTIDLTAIFDEA
jgi:Uma2 family endonuclease